MQLVEDGFTLLELLFLFPFCLKAEVVCVRVSVRVSVCYKVCDSVVKF